MENKSWFAVLLEFANIILARWRLIVIGTILPTAASVVVVLLGTSVYQSEALVTPPNASSGFGSDLLESLTSGSGGALSGLLGGGSDGLDECVNILTSTRFASLMIKRFDLETSYGFKKPGEQRNYHYAHVLKRFRQNAWYEVTKEDAIRIIAKDTSAVRAARMVDAMIHLLDSLYTDVQKSAIKQRLGYVDDRISLAEHQMRQLEDSMAAFQNRHNLLAPEEQVKVMLQNAVQTEIRLETLKEQIALEMALRGNTSARYKDLETQRRLLEKTLSGRIRSSSDTNSLVHSIHSLPAIAAEYYRIERAYMVRLAVYKFLVQQAELLKLDADKNIKVVSVVDPAWVNEKRVSPKRRVIVQIVFTFSLLFWLCFAFVANQWRQYRLRDQDSERLVSDMKTALRRLLPPRGKRG